MNTIQVICLIAIIIVSFLFGRATKRTKLPIMGSLIFEKKGPQFKFNCDSLYDLEKYNYVALKIDSRQNQEL